MELNYPRDKNVIAPTSHEAQGNMRSHYTVKLFAMGMSKRKKAPTLSFKLTTILWSNDKSNITGAKWPLCCSPSAFAA